jgi:hypothetical protein
MAFKGYRVVVLTPMRNGALHRTPWTRWMPREDAMRVREAWSKDQPGRTLAVESKRGALYGVSA